MNRLKQWTMRLAAAGLLFPGIVFAQTFVETPNPVGYVNDFANFIDDDVERQLEQDLSAYELKTTHEITVVTTDSLQQTTIEDLAVRWFEQWGIGKAKDDNGVLLLVVPPERQMRIEVGYGLEGAITDSQAGQILDNILKPAFRSEQESEGIVKAVDTLMKLASGEQVDLESVNDLPPIGILLVFVSFVLLLWLISYIISRNNKKGGGKGKGKSKFRDSFYDADGGFWSDRSPRGGGSGGSFGGFGGGGSGGGGASGSW